MKIYKFIISLILLLQAIDSPAQEEVILYPDSAKNKFVPTGIFAGFDAIGGTKTFLRNDLDWLNFTTGIELYRYVLSVEFGRERRLLEDSEARYETEGNYFRLGPDVNFLFRDPDRSALFLGARYAFNTFSDQLVYQVDDPVWGSSEETIANEGLKADWFEITAGMRVKLFRAVWMGYTGRFKFAVDTFEDRALIPQHIPGYGRADLRSTWEFNYWIMVRLPLSKPPSAIVIPRGLPRTE